MHLVCAVLAAGNPCAGGVADCLVDLTSVSFNRHCIYCGLCVFEGNSVVAGPSAGLAPSARLNYPAIRYIPRMEKILVSACLLGNKVRYDGGDVVVDDPKFSQLIEDHEVIPFCPEVAAGLPTPRAPAEILGGDGASVLAGESHVLGDDGLDVTSLFVHGAELALKECRKQGIKFAVLTEASPSCGSGSIYNGTFSGVKKSGMGVTATLLSRHGIRVFSQHQIPELLAATR